MLNFVFCNIKKPLLDVENMSQLFRMKKGIIIFGQNPENLTIFTACPTQAHYNGQRTIADFRAPTLLLLLLLSFLTYSDIFSKDSSYFSKRIGQMTILRILLFIGKDNCFDTVWSVNDGLSGNLLESYASSSSSFSSFSFFLDVQ